MEPSGCARRASRPEPTSVAWRTWSGVPFATKADLREHYPFGLLAVPREQLRRLHASSGTHGKPTVVGYTAADLETWTELMARCMTMAGVRPGMLVHNANGYGLFTGGLGFHQGAERIGATVVPVSGGFTARQAMLLADFGAHVLVSTPSYALAIAQALEERGIEPGKLALKLGLFGGEPWTEELRGQIERALGLAAINFYGLSEMCGPGVAAECPERSGLHVQEDHFLVEVVDPGEDRRLADGHDGELVFTTLTKEAMPLIRYRTGDLGRDGHRAMRVRAHHGPDPGPARPPRRHADRPGRQPLSLSGRARASGRGGRGPALPAGGGASGRARRADAGVRAGGRAGPHGRSAGASPACSGRQTGLRVDVQVLDPGSIPRSEGKAVRVLDRRG